MVMDTILNVPITFSQWCRCGVMFTPCDCWRCRGARGEPVTPETNARAEAVAKRVDAELKAKRRAERGEP